MTLSRNTETVHKGFTVTITLALGIEEVPTREQAEEVAHAMFMRLWEDDEVSAGSVPDATGLTRGRINQLREDRPLLTGPIREGDQLIWEPNKPHAFTHVEVVELRDEGDGLWIKLAKPDGTGHWNEESRVREACVRR